MKLINLLFPVLICSFLQGCGKQSQDKNNYQVYISDIELSEDLADLTYQMTEKDTIEVLANLTMEWWVRMEKMIITKSNDSIFIQATVKEDTTFELRYQMRVNEFSKVKMKTADRTFENYFLSKLERTDSGKGKNYNWFYKIINQTDTLIFYTYGLGDKGGLVGEHFQFMQEFYPDEEEYIPIKVIEESEINENPG